MSEQHEEGKVRKFDAQGWSRMIVGTIATIVTSWQLFTNDIHGYIDSKGESMVQQVSANVSSDMEVKLDSIAAILKRDCQCPPNTTDRRRRN